jgi:hypothetical protein
MRYRSIAILVGICFALGTGGCESFFDSFKSGHHDRERSEKKSSGRYEEVVMPEQTGSRLRRRTYVERGPESKKKSTTASTTKKKPSPTPKPTATPEPEASPTPKPEEESTPAAERFR